MNLKTKTKDSSNCRVQPMVSPRIFEYLRKMDKENEDDMDSLFSLMSFASDGSGKITTFSLKEERDIDIVSFENQDELLKILDGD